MRYQEDFYEAKKYAELSYLNNFKKRRLMYNGDHWNPLLVPEVSQDATKPLINYIKPNLNHLVSMLAIENPNIDVKPTEPSDEDIAEGLSQLLKRVYEVRKLDKWTQLAIKDMLIYSRGYIGVRWNSQLDGGDGDVEVYVINPFNILKEPVAYSLADSTYVHIRWLRSPDYVYNKYKREFTPNGSDIFDPAKKGVELIESWYLPCKEYPEGRHIIWVDVDNGVLVDEPLPYNVGIPIVEFEYDKISTGDASSMVEDMWGNQLIYMKTLGLIIDNLRYTNNGKYVTSWQNAPEKLPTAPNTIIKIDSPEDIFTPLATPQISPAWFSLLTTAISTFPDISGVREVNMGTTSHGVTAASAIVALQEATKTRRDDIKTKVIMPAMSDLGKILVGFMQQFYTSDKIKKILGKSINIDDPKILDYDVEFQYSQSLPTDKVSRLNIGMQLKQLGLIDDEAFAELFDDPVLKKLIKDTKDRAKQQQMEAMQMALTQAGQGLSGSSQGQPQQGGNPLIQALQGQNNIGGK